jgi:hypothetical protein
MWVGVTKQCPIIKTGHWIIEIKMTPTNGFSFPMDKQRRRQLIFQQVLLL